MEKVSRNGCWLAWACSTRVSSVALMPDIRFALMPDDQDRHGFSIDTVRDFILAVANR
ncbi:hypothetical protein AB4Y35_08515 [Paraburkholderia sp. EG286A]|uniref:hypothetical protein n=1 Tax=Paraburkholderia sp. EG286A TaxID=3237014 RepID=UPI0034D31849